MSKSDTQGQEAIAKGGQQMAQVSASSYYPLAGSVPSLPPAAAEKSPSMIGEFDAMKGEQAQNLTDEKWVCKLASLLRILCMTSNHCLNEELKPCSSAHRFMKRTSR
ncbi:MAG: hypothetical protein AB1757_11755 [Acidobacteriota bacterium]